MKFVKYKKAITALMSLLLVSSNVSYSFSYNHNYINDYTDCIGNSETSEFNDFKYTISYNNDKEFENNTINHYQNINKNTSGDNIFVEGDNKVYFNDISDSSKVVDTWRFDEIKTITINASVKDLDPSSRYIEIRLPLGMELKMSAESIIDNRTIIGVDITQFNKTTVNTNGSYKHMPKMGVIRYFLSDKIDSITMDILVSVDSVLWNTINNVSATSSNDNAIEVVIGDKDAQSIKKLDEIRVTGRDWSSYNNSSFPSSVLNGDDFVIDSYLTIDFVQKVYSRLYKKIRTVVEIPYYEYIEDGTSKRKYAEIKKVELGQNGTYKIEDNKIFIEWTNIYSSKFDYDIYIGTSSLNCPDDTVLKFKRGEVYVKEYFTENEHSVYGESNLSLTIISSTNEKLSFGSHAPSVYKPSIRNYDDNLTYMGGYRITNLGANSKPKKIEFNFPKDGIGIKGVRLITPKEAGYYEVNFTLWNKITGEEVSSVATINKGSTSNDYTGYYFTVSDAVKYINPKIDDPKDYYFKNIDYIVNSFPTGYYSYLTGAPNDTTISGNVVGTIFEDTPVNTSYPITFKLYDVESGLTIQDNRTINISITNNGDSTMALTSGNFTNEDGSAIKELNAGKNFFIKAKMEVASYPYRSTSYVSKPVIHLKLPNGFLIDETKTKFEIVSNEKGIPLTYIIENKDNPREASDGHLIYDIKFLNNPGIGYFKENLGTFGYMNISINIRVSSSVKTMSTNLKDIIFVSDENILIRGGGSWDKYFVKDVYDIDNDGSTTNQIATVGTDVSIGIISNSNWLEVNWLVSKNNEPFRETTSVSLNSDLDSLRFKLNINNINEGITRKENFHYFIAIPKKNVDYPEEIKENEFNFDLKLNSKVQTSDGFKALYSTNNRDFLEWSDSINLNDITMVKIVTTKDILEGETGDIILDMSYVDKSVSSKGNDINMSITGYQDYEKNGSSLKYYHTFDRLKIEINIPPSILESPKDVSVELNKSFQLDTLVDRGAPYATGYWQYKNKNSTEWIDTGVTSQSYSVDKATSDMDGRQYRYVLSNKNGTVYSSHSTISVYGFTITIPKTIELDSSGYSSYGISVTGNIPESSSLEIIPVGESNNSNFFNIFELFGVKNSVRADINQSQTTISNNEIYFNKSKNISGEVQANNLTSGIWRGAFNFNINYKK